MPAKSPYQRVLLKLSGESLSNGKGGVDPAACQKIAIGIKALHDSGVQIGVVIGGGNIFRGIHSSELGIPKTPADHMGMFATMINGIALQHSLLSQKCASRILSALECPKAIESYTWAKAHQYLNDGKVVVFVGGTGNPYFTTDTAAAMRASEIEADLLMKATKVPGVFDKDPVHHDDAKKYQSLSYAEVLAEKLKVMDATAIALCQSNEVPILVFHMKHLIPGEIEEIPALIKGGTFIEAKEGDK